MNQRPLKRNSRVPSPNDHYLKQVMVFAEDAKLALEQQGEEDAAFYFEQLADWIRENPTKAFNVPASKILGL